MTDLPQWAMEKADKLATAVVMQAIDPFAPDSVKLIARALVEARQDGRREALEEAADVADQYDGEGLDGGYDCHLGDARRTQRDITAAIRKLMEKNE